MELMAEHSTYSTTVTRTSSRIARVFAEDRCGGSITTPYRGQIFCSTARGLSREPLLGGKKAIQQHVLHVAPSVDDRQHEHVLRCHAVDDPPGALDQLSIGRDPKGP